MAIHCVSLSLSVFLSLCLFVMDLASWEVEAVPGE